jgi:hypothetical protein
MASVRRADFGIFRYPDPHLDYSGFRHTQKGLTTVPPMLLARADEVIK